MIGLAPTKDDTVTTTDFTSQISDKLGPRIANGSFGEVYRCTVESSIGKTEVAVKVFKTDPRRTVDKLTKAVLRELKVWLRLKHLNIVPLLGTAQFDSPFLALVSQWMSSGTLFEYLREQAKTITTSARIELIKGIAEGVSYLHSENVIHGDLHPGNVLMDDSGNPRLADFGLATVEEDPELQWTMTTLERGFDSRWRAPEVIGIEHKPERPTFKSDIYSLGSAMFFIVSGDIPWKGKGHPQICIELSKRTTPALPHNVFGLHCHLIQECWSWEPGHRPEATRVLNRVPLPPLPPSQSVIIEEYPHKDTTSDFTFHISDKLRFPASDSPDHEMNGLDRQSEYLHGPRPEAKLDSSDHYHKWHSNSRGGPSTSQPMLEETATVFPSRPFMLPPLPSVYDRDIRPLPSRRTRSIDPPSQEEWYGRTDTGASSSSRQQRPISLSIFNSPTATYAWERYEPKSQISYSRPLYVDHISRNSSCSPSSSSISSLRDSPGIPSPALSNRSFSILPQKRRSTSLGEHDEYASSVKKIVEPLKHVNIDTDRSWPSVSFRPYRRTPSPAEMFSSPSLYRSQSNHHDSREHSILNDTDERHRRHENSHCTSDTSNQVTRTAIPAKLESDEWEKYACFTLDGTTRKWLCTWPTESGAQCNYMSKKQLVKRHIETTHLRYKPFVCGVCGKGFVQKTSLDTHMHGHTGSTPHACRYNCGMWFKDPARRHRHMVDEHQYVPRQSKKKHINGQPQDLSDFEYVQQ